MTFIHFVQYLDNLSTLLVVLYNMSDSWPEVHHRLIYVRVLSGINSAFKHPLISEVIS